jgi:hypothetical protein
MDEQESASSCDSNNDDVQVLLYVFSCVQLKEMRRVDHGTACCVSVFGDSIGGRLFDRTQSGRAGKEGCDGDEEDDVDEEDAL